jgi:predicted DNA-binding protein with PD1-like motif
MRRLVQPGPAHPERIESFEGRSRRLEFSLEAGLTLNEALTGKLVADGMKSAAIVFEGGALSPFNYVMPGPPTDDTHVAYFSAPRSPPGETVVEIANATFGWRDGEPFVHCHGAWIEEGTQRRGGHMLPHETTIARSTMARAWALPDVAIAADPDPETNFTLFHPVPTRAATEGDRTIVARIRPNEDITTAIESIARRHQMSAAIVRGSLGSLIGARFADGGRVTDHATEVLVRSGHVHDGVAVLDMLVVDMQGLVHEGRLVRGDNPVCITFELVLEAASARTLSQHR